MLTGIAPVTNARRSTSVLFRRWRRVRVWLIPCMVAAAVCLPSLFGEKWISDTGMYTAISLKAAREGHWWTLHLASGPYFNKPPLPFWVHAAVLRVFGVHDWSIRLPEYLAVIGCVWLTVRLARMFSPPRTAMMAGIILACTTQFVLLVDSFRLDYPHTFFLLAGVVCVAKGVKRLVAPVSRPGRLSSPTHRSGDRCHQRQAGAWLVLSGVPIGCALMTKPLWGLVVYAVLAVWLMTTSGQGRRLVPWLAYAAGVAVLIALPWHASMYALHGEVFWQTYFQRQIGDRMEGKMGPQAGWHWYFTFLSRTYWPWLALVVMAGVRTVRGVIDGRTPLMRDGAGTKLAWAWVLGMLVLLSAFPGKNRYYIYHLYPMLAWLGAAWLGCMAAKLPRGWWRAADRWVLAPAAVALLVGAAAVMPSKERREHPLPKPWPALHEWVREEVGSGRVPAERIYNGSLKYNMNARIYVLEGVWPITSTWNNSPPIQPDVSGGPAWIIFDTDNGKQPNRPRKGDEEVFREEDLLVVKRSGLEKKANVEDAEQGGKQ